MTFLSKFVASTSSFSLSESPKTMVVVGDAADNSREDFEEDEEEIEDEDDDEGDRSRQKKPDRGSSKLTSKEEPMDTPEK